MVARGRKTRDSEQRFHRLSRRRSHFLLEERRNSRAASFEVPTADASRVSAAGKSPHPRLPRDRKLATRPTQTRRACSLGQPLLLSSETVPARTARYARSLSTRISMEAATRANRLTTLVGNSRGSVAPANSVEIAVRRDARRGIRTVPIRRLNRLNPARSAPGRLPESPGALHWVTYEFTGR